MVRSEASENLGAGLICSFLLHGMLVLLVLFGLPELLSPPPEIPEPFVVEVDTIAEKTAPPPRQIEAPKPEELPPEPPKQETPPEPEPKPIPPEPVKPPPPEPPKPVPPPKPIPPEPVPAPIPAPKPKPEPPKEQPKPPPEPLKDLKPPPKKPPPPDDFASLLKSVDKLRQPAKPAPSTPTQAPPVAANKTVNSPLSDLAAQPTTTEKNFVAAQIWPRWNVDLGAKGADTLQVAVKIRVLPDGSVVSADLDVDRARYAGDSFYRAAADAAKRAVLAASPLKVPPTRPDLFRNSPDMTINFDPRSMAR